MQVAIKIKFQFQLYIWPNTIWKPNHDVIQKQAPKRPNIKGKNETGLVPKADRYSQAYDLILSLLSKGEKCFRYFLTIQIQRVCPKTKPGRADTLIVV